MSKPNGPLVGVRVLELGQYIAVPGATQILADQGAEVVKVEPPGGEPTRQLAGYGTAMFHAYNRGKRMVEVDLKTEEGRRSVRALARSSDVLISNFRPGALERLGLGAKELREERPGLIHLSLTGFGAEGEMRRRAGLDIAAQAEAGIMWVTGEAGAEPQRVGFPVVDAAATFALAQVVTSALVNQRNTGTGADIQISLWDVAIQLQASNWMDYALTGDAPVRKGNGQPGAAPAAEVIAVKDGWIVLSAYMPQHWRKLCQLLGRPELETDPRFATSTDRVGNRESMHAYLEEGLSQFTRLEAIETLTEAGLVCGAINDYAEAKAARDAVPDSPFKPISKRRDGDPEWVLGPLSRWWTDTTAVPSLPAALGSHNGLLAEP